jgi:hypothetical protein
MTRTSSGTIYHGEDGARTAGDLWRNGDIFIVRTTGAVWVRTDGAWVAVAALPDGTDEGDTVAWDDSAGAWTAVAHDHSATFAAAAHTHSADDTGWTAATPATGYSTSSMLWSDAVAATYRKLAGVVFLSGAIKCTDDANTTAFTLPEGYRPAHVMIFNGLFVTSGSAEGQESITIEADGDVVVKAPFDNNTYHLDGISFPV